MSALEELAHLERLRPAPAPPLSVDAGQIRRFWEEGYLALEGISNEEELAWLGRVYDLLFEARLAGVPGGYFDLARPYDSDGADRTPQVLHPRKRVPALAETGLAQNGVRIAAAILGEAEATLDAWDHMILKAPRIGAELPWHQDEAYWHPGFDYRALGLWVPLDPATPESGCLSFLPGSHRGELSPHVHLGEDPSIHGLRAEGVEEQGAVTVPVEIGGATVHHCRTLHRSGPNRTENPRRAYATEYQLPPAPRARAAHRPWVVETARAWARRSTPARDGS